MLHEKILKARELTLIMDACVLSFSFYVVFYNIRTWEEVIDTNQSKKDRLTTYFEKTRQDVEAEKERQNDGWFFLNTEIMFSKAILRDAIALLLL